MSPLRQTLDKGLRGSKTSRTFTPTTVFLLLARHRAHRDWCSFIPSVYSRHPERAALRARAASARARGLARSPVNPDVSTISLLTVMRPHCKLISRLEAWRRSCWKGVSSGFRMLDGRGGSRAVSECRLWAGARSGRGQRDTLPSGAGRRRRGRLSSPSAIG